MFCSVCQHDGGNIYDLYAVTFAECALPSTLHVRVVSYCLGEDEEKETVSAPAPPISFSNEMSSSQWESPTLSFLCQYSLVDFGESSASWRVEMAMKPLVEATCGGNEAKAAAKTIRAPWGSLYTYD